MYKKRNYVKTLLWISTFFLWQCKLSDHWLFRDFFVSKLGPRSNLEVYTVNHSSMGKCNILRTDHPLTTISSDLDQIIFYWNMVLRCLQIPWCFYTAFYWFVLSTVVGNGKCKILDICSFQRYIFIILTIFVRLPSFCYILFKKSHFWKHYNLLRYGKHERRK